MKLSKCVVLAISTTSVSAFGFKGAIERAMWYADYLLEEVFENESDMATAVKCVGTRQGIRKQENRCTFMEFCDYLWIAREYIVGKDANGNDIKVEDKKPNLENAKAQLGAEVDALGGKDLGTLANQASSINQGGNMNAPNVADKRPGNSYTGGLDSSKLYKGFPASSEGFYSALQQSTANRNRVGDAFKKAKHDKVLNAKQIKFLDKWAGQGKRGAVVDLVLREKAIADEEVGKRMKKWMEKVLIEEGVPKLPSEEEPLKIKTTAVTVPDEMIGIIGFTRNDKKPEKTKMTYDKLDKDGTIQLWKDSYCNGNLEMATNVFNKAYNTYGGEGLDENHASALHSAEINAHGGGCGFPSH